MDAIILAGGKAGLADPLYELTAGGNKCLLEIGGKPMLQWVLDALSGSKKIDQVVVVGLNGVYHPICSHPVIFLEDQGGIIQNIRAGAQEILKIHPDQDAKALTVSGDVPGITPEMIDWMVETVQTTHHDIYYSVVERKVMEARYPESRRSYVHMKDLEACGGDVNAVRLGEAILDHPVIEELIAERKNAIKQASIIGFGTLFLLLIRQLTLEKTIARICKKLQIKGRAIISPYPEIGMDVDKPFQLEIMRRDLEKRK